MASAFSGELVCTLADLASSPRQRRCARLASGRGILVMLLHETPIAIDALCYHHGAPLIDSGDIEDLNGHAVLRCPWHRYVIDITSGECLYYGLDIATRATTLKSKGQKQRTHRVTLGDGNIYVHESVEPSKVESDSYARMAFPEPGAMPADAGRTGVPIHSSLSRPPGM
jgi:nitrite reductase/ring-hydroxylating ferredoxin subunit